MFDEILVIVWLVLNYCYCCGNIVFILVFLDVDIREFKFFKVVFDCDRVIFLRIIIFYFL